MAGPRAWYVPAVALAQYFSSPRTMFWAAHPSALAVLVLN